MRIRRVVLLVVGLGSVGDAHGWRTRLATKPSTSAAASHVAVSPAGDVYACGYVEKAGTNDDDFLVTKLGGADGEERWRYVYDGTLPETDPLKPKAEACYGVFPT